MKAAPILVTHLSLVLVLLAAQKTYAVELPGSADAGRIDQQTRLNSGDVYQLLPSHPLGSPLIHEAPPQSKNIPLLLKKVAITGMTVFETADVKDIYEPYLNQESTLDTVWAIAAQLTERYSNAGYFLARVVVPQQKIDNGTIVLRVIEGHIGEVKLDSPLKDDRIVKGWINKLLTYKPANANEIESVLLHLNDLPGVSLRAVLEPMSTVESTEGAVRLILEPRESPIVSGAVSLDNFGSRFLGPYQVHAQAQMVLFPMQKTTFSFLSSLPWNKLKYFALKHEAAVFQGGTLELYGSYTTSAPGYTLEPQKIRSHSPTLGAGLNYSIVRQRQENLSARFVVEMHNVDTNILGVPLTRDRVRTARFNLNYQAIDGWNGLNMFDARLSQGVPFLGESRAGQLNLSRAEAEPDFTKLDISLSRQQAITADWNVFGALSGQSASGPLYSSEQFGYGGQSFGRAYDDSEITGDEGIEALIEARYSGFGPWYGTLPVPYGFYDIGAVWNSGNNPRTPYATGSSAGAGFRITSDIGFAGNFGFAFPLTRKIENPIYGNGKSPRFFGQISYAF